MEGTKKMGKPGRRWRAGLKDALKAWDLNMLEGVRHVRDRVNWTNVVIKVQLLTMN